MRYLYGILNFIIYITNKKTQTLYHVEIVFFEEEVLVVV